MRALVRARLALAHLSLTMLEQVCVAEKRLALAQDRKGSVERTLEEFGRSTPDLNSLEQVSPIDTDTVIAHKLHSSYCKGISYDLTRYNVLDCERLITFQACGVNQMGYW